MSSILFKQWGRYTIDRNEYIVQDLNELTGIAAKFGDITYVISIELYKIYGDEGWVDYFPTGDQDVSGAISTHNTDAGAHANIEKRGNNFDCDLFENMLSPTITVLGDSTSNGIDEWVYLLAQKAAAKHPAHNVKYRLYDNPNNRYGVATAIQTAGDDRHLLVSSAAVNGWYLSSSAVPITSGDFDISMRVAADNWKDPNNGYLYMFADGAGNAIGVRLVSGFIRFYWYETDGTVRNVALIDANSWVNGEAHYFRYTIDVDDGAGHYVVTPYTSTDGVVWTAGTPTTGSATSSIRAGATVHSIGVYGGGGSATGKYYEVIIRDGIGGRIVNPQPIDSWLQPVTTTILAGSPTITFYNASISGYGISNFDAQALIDKCVYPQIGAMCLVNLGHNDGGTNDAAYIAKYTSLLGLISGRIVSPEIYMVTQNPFTSPSTFVINRASRRRVLVNLALKNGIGYIDTYKAFVEDGRSMALLVNPTDGVHPLAAGSQLWADTIADALGI